jgi:flagellar motility protein MotE (MotC chaperone)
VNKKMIIIIAIVGFVSFAGTFAIAWLIKPASESQTTAGVISQSALLEQNKDRDELKLPQIETAASPVVGTSDRTMERSMTDKKAENLVYELKQKMQEYNNKLQSLQKQESRLQITQDTVKKDIENLNNLRIELASVVVGLKEQRDKLLKSRVEIAEAEKVNLAKIAATYDKMDATSASKILANMYKNQPQNVEPGEDSSNMNDAVKILYYMNERTKAKLLAELVTSEPELAAVLCGKLKQVVEVR